MRLRRGPPIFAVLRLFVERTVRLRKEFYDPPALRFSFRSRGEEDITRLCEGRVPSAILGGNTSLRAVQPISRANPPGSSVCPFGLHDFLPAWQSSNALVL